MSKMFTPEQYKAEYSRIMNDARYPPSWKGWMIDTIKQMYRDYNNGQEPPAMDEESTNE